MIYCDTSLLVSALVATEPASEAAEAWLVGQAVGDSAVSDWVQAEFVGAIALKTRRGDLDEAAKARVLRVWSALHASFRWLTVERHHFDHAARLMLEPKSRLRSGDALHLAVAAGHGCMMATLDRDLRDASAALGLYMEGLPSAS